LDASMGWMEGLVRSGVPYEGRKGNSERRVGAPLGVAGAARTCLLKDLGNGAKYLLFRSPRFCGSESERDGMDVG